MEQFQSPLIQPYLIFYFAIFLVIALIAALLVFVVMKIVELSRRMKWEKLEYESDYEIAENPKGE